MTVMPNPLGAALRFRERRAKSVAETDTPHASFGRVHVILAPHSEATEGRVAEAFYRLFEIALASIALIVTLPLMLAAAILVGLNSSGTNSLPT